MAIAAVERPRRPIRESGLKGVDMALLGILEAALDEFGECSGGFLPSCFRLRAGSGHLVENGGAPLVVVERAVGLNDLVTIDLMRKFQ